MGKEKGHEDGKQLSVTLELVDKTYFNKVEMLFLYLRSKSDKNVKRGKIRLSGT